MNSQVYQSIRKLTADDNLANFDCEQPALNQFLQRFALNSQKANSAQTYVCCLANQVVGFYSLAVGCVEASIAPDRLIKGLPKHPVAVMILARLAVDVKYQGLGLGSALLKDALLRTAQAADIAGIRALLVHAKDDNIRNGYLNWEFEASVTDPLHLFLLIKDLKTLLQD